MPRINFPGSGAVLPSPPVNTQIFTSSGTWTAPVPDLVLHLVASDEQVEINPKFLG